MPWVGDKGLALLTQGHVSMPCMSIICLPSRYFAHVWYLTSVRLKLRPHVRSCGVTVNTLIEQDGLQAADIEAIDWTARWLVWRIYRSYAWIWEFSAIGTEISLQMADGLACATELKTAAGADYTVLHAQLQWGCTKWLQMRSYVLLQSTSIVCIGLHVRMLGVAVTRDAMTSLDCLLSEENEWSSRCVIFCPMFWAILNHKNLYLLTLGPLYIATFSQQLYRYSAARESDVQLVVCSSSLDCTTRCSKRQRSPTFD